MQDELERKIKTLNETIWGGSVNGRVLEAWLHNFQHSSTGGTDERLCALHLLSQFMYFGLSQVRELLRALYRDMFKYPIVESIRRAEHDTTDVALIDAKFREELSKTRFLAVGNPSESGALLLYFFRQENKLRKELFWHSRQIFTRQAPAQIDLREPHVHRYVFLDDVCGSGEQGKLYSRDVLQLIKDRDPQSELCFYVLFGTTCGMAEVRRETLFDNVKCVYELDETYRCFCPGDQNRYFRPEDKHVDRDKALDMCKRYGEGLWKEHPLGYKDGQLLLGLYYNTPDNTLPVFWCEDNWHPVFKRYVKF